MIHQLGRERLLGFFILLKINRYFPMDKILLYNA